MGGRALEPGSEGPDAENGGTGNLKMGGRRHVTPRDGLPEKYT